MMDAPDRLSIESTSPHYNLALLERGVRVWFKGVEKFNVAEYCISERWVRVLPGWAPGMALPMERGKLRTMKMQGDVKVALRS